MKLTAWESEIILDLVMNHTSIEHPWFKESRSSLSNPKRDWYIWKEGQGRRRPNNWKSALGGSAWEFTLQTKQYYYHSFFREQPDLNWRNKALQEEFFRIVRFWLDMGVDGFRLDVINMIVKDKKFRNTPPLLIQLLGKENNITRNRPKSYKIVQMLREVIDQYEGKMLVGEIYALPPGHPDLVASYLSHSHKGLHMAFDFSLIFKRWNAKKYYRAVQKWMNCIPEEAWPCHVLSNHDLNRPLKSSWRKSNADSKAKIMAALLLTLKGTPFLYYGDEIGMQNAKIPRRKLVDPIGKRFWPFYTGRDKSRTPMQWDDSTNGGFTNGNPWLPVNNDFYKRNISLQLTDDNSILQFYSRLLKMRRSSNALRIGDWIPMVQGEKNIMAYMRIYRIEKIFIVLNFSSRIKKIIIPLPESVSVILSTHRRELEETELSPLVLFPYEASLFRVID